MDLLAKMVEQCELAGLVRRFKHHLREPKRLRELICESGVEPPGLVKKPDAAGAFSGFDDELERTAVKPAPALIDKLGDVAFGKGSGMLFAEFKLNVEPPQRGHPDNLAGHDCHFGEPFATLDAVDPDVGAQVQIFRKRAL